LAQGSKKICEAYLQALEKWANEGLKTICTDEKTGMQALERGAPDLPMQVTPERLIWPTHSIRFILFTRQNIALGLTKLKYGSPF
jgi:hypothetical protein